MAKGIWRREGDTAVPVGADSLEYLQAIKEGAEFVAETHGARNLKQLKMWWTLCEMVAENHPIITTKTSASDNLKLALHCIETFLSPDGRLHIKPKSIAFESMTQEEFNPLFKLAIDKVAEWLGNTPKEVQDRFNEITADKRYSGMRR